MLKIINKKIVIFILIFSFTLPAGVFVAPQQAHAIPVEEVGPNLIQSTISAVSNAASKIYQYTLTYKETVLDGIAWYVAKAIIRTMTTSIVNWINSGFDGNPSFVTDPAGMFENIADEELGKFVAGSSDLNFLCQPFAVDIRIALAFRYRPFQQKITCTFSDIVKNTTNAGNSFIQGNFAQGGWDQWISLTTEPQNNYIGAYLQAEDELTAKIANAQANQQMELGWGKGFLSWKTCAAYATGDTTKSNFYGPRQSGTDPGQADFVGPLQEAPPSETGKDGTCVREETQTPGTVIESGLENVLGSGVRQLELADEFNEVVNALFAQMLKTVLSSDTGGLKGTSGAGSFDTNSYINKMSTQQSPEEAQALANIKDNSTQGIDASLASETTYLNNKQATLAEITKAKAALVNAEACYQQKLSLIPDAQGHINQLQNIIDQSVVPVEISITADTANTINLLAQLNSAKAAISSAQTIGDTADPAKNYQTIIQNQSLHDTAQVINSGEETSNMSTTTAAWQVQANTQLQQCQQYTAIHQ